MNDQVRLAPSPLSGVAPRNNHQFADGAITVFGESEMGDRIRLFNWSTTPLGSIQTWPQSLKTAVHMMLASRYPMCVWWGSELINIYNDHHIAVHGKRHPQALVTAGRN